MKRAKAFYGAVLETELKDENTGPNPMAIFPAASDASVAGHLYPGKPAAGGSGNTIHLRSPEPLEAALDRVRDTAARCWATSSRFPPGVSPIASTPTATASASSATEAHAPRRPALRDRTAPARRPAGHRAGAGGRARGFGPHRLPRRRRPPGFRQCRSTARPASATCSVPATTCRRLCSARRRSRRSSSARGWWRPGAAARSPKRRARRWCGSPPWFRRSGCTAPSGCRSSPPLLRFQDGERANLDRFAKAIADRLKTRFAYRDADGTASERLVWPLALHFWGQVWTLAAWCELRDDFRTFRIDRAEWVMVTDEAYPNIAGRTLLDYLEGVGVTIRERRRYRARHRKGRSPARQVRTATGLIVDVPCSVSYLTNELIDGEWMLL